MDRETLKQQIKELEFTIENYDKFGKLDFLKNRMPTKHHLEQDLEFKKRDLENVQDSEEVEERLKEDFNKLDRDKKFDYLYNEIQALKERDSELQSSIINS